MHHFLNQEPFKNQSFFSKIYNKLADPFPAFQLLKKLHQEYPFQYEYLVNNAKSLKQIMVLTSNSPFFSNFLIKYNHKIKAIFPVEKENIKEYNNRLKAENIIEAILYEKDEDKSNKIDEKEITYKKLRLFHKLEFIKICVSDYLGYDTFEETIQKISLTAECCISYAFKVSGLKVEEIAVIAMGKLGGSELNYSSDIDLMFVNLTPLKDKQATEQKVYYFIDLLNRNNSDGFVFRIDTNIAIEGGNEGFIFSLLRYEKYYQTRARNWELQALIKARVIIGGEKIIEIFERFKKRFIFSGEISSPKILQDITQTKLLIEQEIKNHKNDLQNVKLGAGGIRDIEFMVQFFQIHHGKLCQDLNIKGTLPALRCLLDYGIITETEYKMLYNAYVFLRRIEHFLQLRQFLPVRNLPQASKELGILLKICCFSNVINKQLVEKVNNNYFLNIHNEITNNVKEMFRKIFIETSLFINKIEKS